MGQCSLCRWATNTITIRPNHLTQVLAKARHRRDDADVTRHTRGVALERNLLRDILPTRNAEF